jgi:hypothetical protein
MPLLQPRELYPVFKKDFGYLVKSGGKWHNFVTHIFEWYMVPRMDTQKHVFE